MSTIDPGPPPQLIQLILSYLKDGQSTTEFDLRVMPLAQDGSTRRYFRVYSTNKDSFIAVDAHKTGGDPKTLSAPNQNQTFHYLACHLLERGFPVPRILQHSSDFNFYLLCDLGEVTLCSKVLENGHKNKKSTLELYQKALDLLFKLQTEALINFEHSWCYAGSVYDRNLILENELNYFLKAFVKGYLKLTVSPKSESRLQAEFQSLADEALLAPGDFFLYRDFQSKNLMLKDKMLYLIDFQGARSGPFYYDLASLLNDPYTQLLQTQREQLLSYYYKQLCNRYPKSAPDNDTFTFFFHLYSLVRTLQTLGAFAFLTRQGRKHFQSYMAPALENFHHYLARLSSSLKLDTLVELSHRLYEQNLNVKKRSP